MTKRGCTLRARISNCNAPSKLEGVADGRFLTVNHVDYIGARSGDGSLRLYPIDGSETKAVASITQSDTLIGGSPEEDEVYVSLDRSVIPQEIMKVNIATGKRQSFAEISPTDPAGILGLGTPCHSQIRRQRG